MINLKGMRRVIDSRKGEKCSGFCKIKIAIYVHQLFNYCCALAPVNHTKIHASRRVNLVEIIHSSFASHFQLFQNSTFPLSFALCLDRMAARALSSALPQVDYPILDYVTSLFNDADPDDHPIDSFIRPLLQSESIPEEDINLLCITLQALWDAQIGTKIVKAPAKLERVLDMRRAEAMSKKSASEGNF